MGVPSPFLFSPHHSLDIACLLGFFHHAGRNLTLSLRFPHAGESLQEAFTWADSRAQRNHLRAPGWRSYFVLILDYGNDAAFEDFFLLSCALFPGVCMCLSVLPWHQAEALRSWLPHQAAPMGAAGWRAHVASLLPLETPHCPPPHSPH